VTLTIRGTDSTRESESSTRKKGHGCGGHTKKKERGLGRALNTSATVPLRSERTQERRRGEKSPSCGGGKSGRERAALLEGGAHGRVTLLRKQTPAIESGKKKRGPFLRGRGGATYLKVLIKGGAKPRLWKGGEGRQESSSRRTRGTTDYVFSGSDTSSIRGGRRCATGRKRKVVTQRSGSVPEIGDSPRQAGERTGLRGSEKASSTRPSRIGRRAFHRAVEGGLIVGVPWRPEVHRRGGTAGSSSSLIKEKREMNSKKKPQASFKTRSTSERTAL